MTITVEAVYENGALRLTAPLPLNEHEKIQVTIVRHPSVAAQSYGMMDWTGGDATLEGVARDPDLDPQENA